MSIKNARAGLMSFVAGCLLAASGCCGICGGQCQVYTHPEPSCCGIHYEGCCTCKDDCRDFCNQLSDILLP
jgi:hypothetical protein